MPSARGGFFSLSPTTTIQEIKRTGNVGGSGGAFGSSLNAGYTYEVSETVKKTKAAALVASKRVRGRSDGARNSAEWTLYENGSTNDGIPTFMRAAVLLVRPLPSKNRKFLATVTIDTQVDVITAAEEGLKSLFGKKKVPLVDPIIFEPTRKDSPESVFEIDPKNLKAKNLEDISVVLSKNILTDAIKGEMSLHSINTRCR
jgi:hypothetical protein